MPRPSGSPSLLYTFSTGVVSFAISAGLVANTWSRMLNSSARWTSGAMKCVPGYSVPDIVPESWLTRTAAIPLGTTRMLSAGSSRIHASRARRDARCPRTTIGCDARSAATMSIPMTAAAAASNPNPANMSTYLISTMTVSLVGEKPTLAVCRRCGLSARTGRPERAALHLVQSALPVGHACEEPRGFVAAFGVQFDDVAGAHAFEETLDVLVAQADAAVRLRKADRLRAVGAVNAVALRAEADPPRADRVGGAGADHFSRLVVGRVGDEGDDVERADRAGRARCADRNRVDADDLLVFDQRELAIRQAHHDPPRQRRVSRARALGCHCASTDERQRHCRRADPHRPVGRHVVLLVPVTTRATARPSLSC